MRIFRKIVGTFLKICFQYRNSFAISLIIQPIIMLINIALFNSIYAYNGTSTIKGYGLSQMIWYFSALSFVYAFCWNGADIDMSRMVLSGDLSIYLLKPVSVAEIMFGQAIGARTIAIFFEFIPGVILYSLFYFPNFLTLFSILKFLVVVMFAMLLFFVVNFLIGLSAFILKDNVAVTQVKYVIVSLLGGGFLPLEFFPAKFNAVINFLPFKYMLYWPVQFFINKADNKSFFKVIGLQAIWIVSLYCLCRILWTKSIKKFCAVGG